MGVIWALARSNVGDAELSAARAAAALAAMGFEDKAAVAEGGGLAQLLARPNPKPPTLGPKPGTRNSEPSAGGLAQLLARPNPKPPTLSPKPGTRNSKPSAGGAAQLLTRPNPKPPTLNPIP